MCVRYVLMLTDKAMLPLFIKSSFTYYISVVLQSDELSKTRRLNKKYPSKRSAHMSPHMILN